MPAYFVRGSVCVQHSRSNIARLEVLKSSFRGRYKGRWSDVSSDAGAAWAVIERVLRENKQEKGEE